MQSPVRHYCLSVFPPIILAFLLSVFPHPAMCQQPVVSQGGVLNAADYSTSIASGSMIAIFGSNLSSGSYSATEVPLPSELGGVRIDVTDSTRTRAAAIWFVSPGQINAQLPFNLSGSSVQLRVYRSGLPSSSVTVPISDCGPGFYTWTGTGQGAVAALHNADWTIVNEDNPAVPGEYLILYATGLGPVTDTPALTGQPGGDNAQWGPVNWAERDVTVTIGGQSVAPLFAGLAPGFVGLYQINVQVPADLATGEYPIVLTAGGSASQGATLLPVLAGSTGTEPADVVQRALEAQVRGDVDGFLAECSTGSHTAEEIDGARELLGLVRDNVGLSSFEFTPLATGYGDLGTMAVVRAWVSVTAQAADGTHQVTQGAVAFLEKVEGVWKILNIVPDDLLNQQLYEESINKPVATGGPEIHRVGTAVNLEEFNNSLNQLLNSASVDEFKLGRSATFGIIGQIPGVGDTLANINQVVEAVENTGGGIYEVYQNGFTGIALIKFKQVGVGVLQIVLEPIPGLDAQADLVQASLEQLGHNLELSRAIGQVQYAIRQLDAGETKVNPYLFPYPAYAFSYPAGVEMKPMTDAPPHSYGTPLGTIVITAPTAFDLKIPLMIAGEMPISSSNPAASIALQLGGQERGGIVYLPVEVGYLAEEDASNGDIILDNYNRYRTNDSVSRVVSWNVTCRRGLEDLKVRLRNGEVTPVVFVDTFMNKVDALQVSPLTDGKIEAVTGEPVTGIRVVGTGPQIETRFWPDLTNRNQCLDIVIPDSDIADLIRGDTLTVDPLEAGETSLELLLAGSAAGGGDVPDVTESIPIVVTGEPAALFEDSWTHTFYNGWWQADLTIRITSAKKDIALTTDMVSGSVRYLIFDAEGDGSYGIEVTANNIKSTQEGASEEGLRFFGQVDGSDPVEGTSFSTTLQVSAENNPVGRYYFSLIVYRESESGALNWLAGDLVIGLMIQ